MAAICNQIFALIDAIRELMEDSEDPPSQKPLIGFHTELGTAKTQTDPTNLLYFIPFPERSQPSSVCPHRPFNEAALIHQRLLSAVIIAICLSALLSTACGLFTFPGDGSRAIATNMQVINLDIPLVDDYGHPLDDVKIEITRHALSANIIMPGTYNDDTRDLPTSASKRFKFTSLGNAAVTVTFSKPGYTPVTCTYAKVDAVPPAEGFMFGAIPPQPCINISKNPPPAIVLKPTPR